jgi:hypothetical protein
MIELTRIAKTGGPLTKKISLSPDGGLVADGSACLMSRGHAQRVGFDSLNEFADMLASLESHEAVALGNLREDLPASVQVLTQDRLTRLNGAAAPGTIARTAEHITYASGRTALALVDIDTKGMPETVRQRITTVGGYWKALVTALPSLAATARIVRTSTSTGIFRTDTGEAFAGSSGIHIYLLVQDGTDIERFLRTLHDRLWLHGFGWFLVGAAGQLLDRSLADRMVGQAERLVFEGPPVLVPPLAQDLAARRPEVHEGDSLDTRTECPPLRIVELARLKDLKAKSAEALAPARARERDRFIAKHAGSLAPRAGITHAEARRVIERQAEGVLLPDLVLPWDDEEFAGCTVADVLVDPARFVGATMADPLEGPDYGHTKAMVMRRPNGTAWLHSFAHGLTRYELRFDARAIRTAIESAPPDQAPEIYASTAVHADLDAEEIQGLRAFVSERSGIGLRALDAKAKARKADHDVRAGKEQQDRQAAARCDPRPQIDAPMPDAPWLPQMQVLNDVLGASTAPIPPMRDIDGAMTVIRIRRVPHMHLLTAQSVNDGEAPEDQKPAAEQPLLTRMDETQLSEMIEDHIDYYLPEPGRSVHLGGQFVKHFLTRTDDALPTVAAIASLPIVLQDGTLLSKYGLDRKRGIVFMVPKHILPFIPHPKDCTAAAVAQAMRFLTEDWLCDVAADYSGKCMLIAAALTIIERSLLSDRPTFFVTTGRRGGGKTTALIMLLMAVTGVRPSAAAWSPNEEERRKALLAYLMEALPAIVWDNIPRGTQISCPHIEKSCTTAFYSDRKLGVSEFVAVSASVIHLFTGNNIGPKGDLASRSLQIRLEIDRADPENRDFEHPDPVGWTETNRGQILRALYTILLGNPVLRSNVKAPTRFKTWWHVVGSAVENAAQQHVKLYHDAVAATVMGADPTPLDAGAIRPMTINFRDLFLVQEEDDEESASLGDALAALAGKWPDGANFKSADIAKLINNRSEYQIDSDKECAATAREFLFPNQPLSQDVSPKSVTKMIKRHIGEPVKSGKRTLVLKTGEDAHTKTVTFHVLVKKEE